MFKTNYIFLIFVFLLLRSLNAQNEANIWMMPKNNGINFNNDSISFLDGCVLKSNESSSSICDKNGNLLFYSNGITLYNRFHQIVKNGINLGFPIGINETTSRQGTLLLKHPNNDSLIYLFSNDYQGRGGGLVYATINIHGNNDSGKVLNIKNKLLSFVNEPITAVNHHNGRDIWIVVHSFGGKVFYLFLLTKNGILDCRLEQNHGISHSKMSGVGAQVNMKFSPNGSSITHHQLINGNTETLNFNNLTGLILDTIFIKKLNYAFGIEYSSNSNYLYIQMSLDSGFAQINLKTRKHTKLDNFDQNKMPTQLQLAPDGKVYGAIYNSKDLFVVNNPNLDADSSNVIIKKNFLKNISNIAALPNFNQSYFYTPAINYSYEMNCTKNSIQFLGKDTFGANSHNWHIRKLAVGSWQSAGSAKDVNYSLADTGTYEVRYIAANGNKADTVTKSITIYDKIKKDFLGKDTVFAEGAVINKTLFAPLPNHCVRWQDSSGLNTFTATKKGTYICKVTNAAFCEVWDTIVINTCINNLNQPSLFRSRDSLKTWHLNADSFVWFRNNQLYKITKQPFLKLTDTGTYRVEAAKKGHCNSSSIGTNYVKKLSVNGVTIADLGIRVFPNPSSGVVRIESSDDFKLEVRDLLGRVFNPDVILINFVPEIYSESIQLPKGVYFFVFDVKGYRVAEKVVLF